MKPTDNSIFKYLDDNGDGTGNKSANGDYSATPVDFYYEEQSIWGSDINRMIVYIEDVGSFDSGTYGNGIALTNGITVKVLDNNDKVLIDLTGGEPVKQNGHWAKLCYDADPKAYGQGNEYLTVRWTFSKSGQPLILLRGYKLVVNLSDDMTGLVEHTFNIQGVTR